MRRLLFALFGILLSASAAQAAEVALEGSFTQGGLVFGKTAPGAEVTFNGAPLRLTGDGRFLFGLGPISGVYGSQRILNGEPRQPHFGVDVAGPVGTPVKAPADGVVTLAHPDMYFSGATLIMDHGHGLSSTFLHLEKILVQEGQRVKQGEVVALMGKSGRVTGPHLDWRMNWRDERIDPTLLVPPMPKTE